MVSRLMSIGLVLLFSAGALYGQDSLNTRTTFPPGIQIEYGIGHYAVTDEYISKEKYSGTMPSYALGWARSHETYVYRLDLNYRNANEIRNNNVTTDITQFTLNQAFLYALSPKSLFNKDLYLWLGPATEFFFFYNDQNIAVSGFDYAQSVAALFSVGLNMHGIYPLNSKIQLESSLKLTVLSLGFRMVDNEEEDETAVKILTLFSGLNSGFDLGARYILCDHLAVKLAYRLEVTRISAWTPLLSASDNAVFGLTYSF